MQVRERNPLEFCSGLAVGVNYTSLPNTSCISLSNKTPSLHLLQVWVCKCVCTRLVVRIWAPSYGEASAAAWLHGLRAALYSRSHKGFLPFLALSVPSSCVRAESPAGVLSRRSRQSQD